MLSRRVIPCLDVRDGRVVKGVRFQGLRDVGDPASLAGGYEAAGADEITVLDVSATPEHRATATDIVARVRSAISIPLMVGGGVRSIDDVARLLEAGADKVAINTAAIRNPALITDCAERFGSQCVVLSIDASRLTTGSGWAVVAHSGTERTSIDAIQWGRRGVDLGAGEVLLTSWDRDGTRSGYDLDLIRSLSRAIRTPVVASGGASNAGHMLEAIHAGADAVLAAGIFHDGSVTVGDVKMYLGERGEEIRR
jgi:imidazoleglycerol phosphate synthase cyclase subunit